MHAPTYDIKVIIQIICRHFRILYYGKKHSIISKQVDIRCYISFQIMYAYTHTRIHAYTHTIHAILESCKVAKLRSCKAMKLCPRSWPCTCPHPHPHPHLRPGPHPHPTTYYLPIQGRRQDF